MMRAAREEGVEGVHISHSHAWGELRRSHWKVEGGPYSHLHLRTIGYTIN